MVFSKEQIKAEYLRGETLRYSETKSKEIYRFIERQIQYDISHKEKVYCFIYSHTPKCQICNNIPKFENFKSGFKKFCCVSCSSKASKQKQDETRFKNIQNLVNDLSIKEIVDSLYNKTLKIKSWRKIEKLSDYYSFSSLEQVYNHVVLGNNQICEYCGCVLSIIVEPTNSHNSFKTRKCNCLSKEERLIFDLNNEIKGVEFIKFIIKNKLHYNLEIKKHKDLIIEEYIKRTGKMLRFTKSLNEDMYCKLHKINEHVFKKQFSKNKFVDLKHGYKSVQKMIDFSKSNIEILKDLKEKYTNKGLCSALETKKWIEQNKKHCVLDGETTLENIFLIFNERKYCKICGSKTSFNPNKQQYKDYCSSACVSKGESEKIKTNFRENFKLNRLPEILNEHCIELLEKYVHIHKTYKIKCKKCNNIYYGCLATTTCICRKCNPKISGFSNKEKEVLNFIKEIYKGNVLENFRNFGKEFDIYIPEKKLAIEFNGIYWHSNIFKSDDYHLNKTNLAEKNDIHLIHVFENEWDSNKEKIKSYFKTIFNKNKNINVNDCEIVSVSNEKTRDFLYRNSLNKKFKNGINYGIKHNNELMFVLNLTRKKDVIEIVNFSFILGYNIVGGLEKILKFIFEIFKTNPNEKFKTFEIKLNLDRSYYSTNNIFTENDFKIVSKDSQNYHELSETTYICDSGSIELTHILT